VGTGVLACKRCRLRGVKGNAKPKGTWLLQIGTATAGAPGDWRGLPASLGGDIFGWYLWGASPVFPYFHPFEWAYAQQIERETLKAITDSSLSIAIFMFTLTL